MIEGLIYSFVAGVFIVLQSVFNARLGESVGSWPSNVFVHGSGFIFALFVLLILSRQIQITNFKEVPPYYLLGGVFGAIIIFSVMQGISILGVSYAITIIIVTQVVGGFLIDYFGLFGEAIASVNLAKIAGLILMIVGLIMYQLS
ncbi:MAG: DMT family transporter [Halarsenatibacteraceae bacterium]